VQIDKSLQKLLLFWEAKFTVHFILSGREVIDVDDGLDLKVLMIEAQVFEIQCLPRAFRCIP
jgi:hypothetical protein